MTIPPNHDPRADCRADADLLAALIAGDTNALAVLVHRYQRVLLSLVRNLAWFEPDPEVVVQEVWMRVLQSAATFSGQAKVSTWLHRVTVNEAISAARRRRTQRATPVGEVFDGVDISDRTEPADPAQSVVDRVHAAAVLPELLTLLTREQRLVLEVLHLDGLTHEEAAQLLGVAVGTVKSRAHRARAAILAQLATQSRREDQAES